MFDKVQRNWWNPSQDPLRQMSFRNQIDNWKYNNPIEKYSTPEYWADEFKNYVLQQYYECTKGYEFMFDNFYEMTERFKEVIKSNEDMKSTVIQRVRHRDDDTVLEIKDQILRLQQVARRTKKTKRNPK